MKILKIVSGAQTGADRGGLDAAVYCGLQCGGWVPKGWKAEDGVIPEEYRCLGLRETGSDDYTVRTEANVVDSDATVILCKGNPTGGSLKTVEFAEKHLRPYLVVDLNRGRTAAADAIVAWLKCVDADEGVLNVAGSRESKSPGIQELTEMVMIDVISRVNGKLFYPIRHPIRKGERGFRECASRTVSA